MGTPRAEPPGAREHGEDMTRSIYDEVWEQFVRGDTLSEMPSRDVSGVGLIVRIQAQAIVEQVDAIQRQIEQIGEFVPSPLDALHLTVRNLGVLVDQPKGKQTISPGQLPDVIEAIGRGLSGTHGFMVHLRRVNSFSVCPIVEAHNSGHILAIRQNLEPELDSLGLTDYDYGPHGFIPHLTLGYYRKDSDGAIARQVLGELREVDIGQIQVTELTLIRADLTAGVCCLEPIHEYKLL